MTEDFKPETPVLFSDFALAEPILQAIREVGYEKPSAIQAQSIPSLLEGRDLLGQAQTGTGKTAAFALPLLSRIDLTQRKPQLLVLAPTRELALQVAEAMQKYARHLPDFHILPVYGGQGMGQQLRQLERGVQVIVGTPGRILDHLNRKSLDLSAIKAVVLDEADEMLRMGFIDDVDVILGHMPEQRQVALFSATMPAPIKRIAMRHLKNPAEIKVAAKTTTVDTITQRYWQVRGVHKLDALTRILEVTEFDAMIIFVRTKVSTEELAEKLEARGFSSAPLNGDLNQQQRERTVERLKQGKLDIIVATDVAARGLDVPRISHVFNYDIPTDTESYVHRIGRTGRAGRSGEAILFVAPREKRMLFAIEKATNQKIEPMQLPTRNEIVGHRIDLFKKQLTEVRHTEQLTFFRELLQQYQSENDLEMEDIAAALAWLVQRDQPLQPVIADEPAQQPETPRSRLERERGDRPAYDPAARAEQKRPRSREESQEPPVKLDMRRYRIDVGRVHGVQAKNIVGAIANEIGLDSEYIDNIRIQEACTLLDLPDGMPRDVFEHLKTVRVCGRPLAITANIDTEAVPAPSKGRLSMRAGEGAKPRTRTAGAGESTVKRARGEGDRDRAAAPQRKKPVAGKSSPRAGGPAGARPAPAKKVFGKKSAVKAKPASSGGNKPPRKKS